MHFEFWLYDYSGISWFLYKRQSVSRSRLRILLKLSTQLGLGIWAPKKTKNSLILQKRGYRIAKCHNLESIFAQFLKFVFRTVDLYFQDRFELSTWHTFSTHTKTLKSSRVRIVTAHLRDGHEALMFFWKTDVWHAKTWDHPVWLKYAQQLLQNSRTQCSYDLLAGFKQKNDSSDPRKFSISESRFRLRLIVYHKTNAQKRNQTAHTLHTRYTCIKKTLERT